MADPKHVASADAAALESAAASRCPRCGQTFGCGVAQQTCWCHAVPLSAAALAQLRERYDACLCPGCLQEWATGSAAGSEQDPDVATATTSGSRPMSP